MDKCVFQITAFHYSEVQQCLKEETSGGCNVLHVIAALTAPVPPPPSSSSSSAGGPRSHHSRHSGLREMMKHALALASSSGSSNGKQTN